MNCKKIATRALSMLLCIIMIAGIIPVSVSAAADPIIFAGSTLSRPSSRFYYQGVSAPTVTTPQMYHHDASIWDSSKSASDSNPSPTIEFPKKYHVAGSDDMAMGTVDVTAVPVLKLYYRTNKMDGQNLAVPTTLEYTDSSWSEVKFTNYYDATNSAPATKAGEWGYIIVNFSNASIGSGGKKLRDIHSSKFLTSKSNEYIDIAYIGFFDSVASAKAAEWKSEYPSVTFYDANGTTVFYSYQTWKAGGTVTLPAENPDPTQVDPDASFIGWFTEEDGMGTEYKGGEAIPAAGLELYPFISTAYNVTFDCGDGSPIVKPIEANEALVLPAENEIPAKRGYDFVGWYTALDDTGVKITNDDGTVKSDYTPVTATATYFAKYELSDAEEIKVVYMLDTEGDSAYAVETYTTHDTITLLTEGPAKVGYTFDAWDIANAEGVAETCTANETDLIATFLADDATQIVIRPTFSVSGTSYVAPAGVDATPEYLYFTVEAGSLGVKNYGTYSSTRVNDADGLDYIRVKSTKGSALANSDNAVMVFGSDVQLGTYPVMVVGYNKTHARGSEIQASYNAGASMFWGIGNVGNDNGTSQIVIEGNEFDNYIVDLSKGSWTGAAGDPQGWANHKDNSLNNFWVRFMGGGSAPLPGEHFDLAYVAFFQDVDAAKDFANANAADALEPVLVNVNGKNTSVPAGYSVILPEAKVEPFKDFSHYEDEDGNVYQAGDEVVATTNKTITAVYTDASSFRVTYYDGNSELATFELPAGTVLDHIENVGEMQAPDGQDFTGWFYEGSQWEIVDGYVLDRDMDLVASYDMTYRYVTYVVDGAAWKVEEYTRGEGILLPELTVEEIGERTFLDWKTADGNCTIANGEKVYTNLVLEADFYEAERTSESAPLTVLIGVMKKIKEHQGKPTMATGKRPYALFDGKELAICSGINGIEGKLEDGYYRFELRADTNMKDGTLIQIRFLSDTPITLAETPVMVVGYRTNVGGTMGGDMCWYDENMAVARAWGGASGVNKAPTIVADEKWQKAIINMENRRYTGGDGKMAGKTLDEMQELGMNMQFAGFNRRFGSIGTTALKGSYLDIQYIAFFKSVEDAGSFTYAEGILDELEIKAQREAEKAAAAEEAVEETVEETVE
ncbi:MAG: hypothetical protein E7635_06595 [Ruminococcaceae bacterium]|nr:hypothetical protein [Oscillospiraceae bacterium]